MSQIYFKKEGMKNYMVIPCEQELPENYQNYLFQYHEVPYFLQYEVRQMNGKQFLYYRLKYRTTLKSVLGHLQLTYFRLTNMVTCIVEVMEMTEEYLLEQDRIVWEMDKIFIEADTGKLQFCYSPAEEGQNSLKDLLTEIMQAVNKKDEKSTLFILQFYNIVTEPDCSLENLKGYVERRLPKEKSIRDYNSEYRNKDCHFSEQQRGGQKEIKEGDKIWENKSEAKSQDKESQKEEGYKSLAERITQILLIITAGVNVVLIICLLFNIVTYDYIRYLFISMGLLILFTIIYMQVSKEETADEIMQEYFENNKDDCLKGKTEIQGRKEEIVRSSQEKKEYTAEDESQWGTCSETVICGETGVLMDKEIFRKEEEKTAIVMEEYNKHLYLESIEKGKYDSIRIGKESVILGTMADSCNYTLMARGISRMHAKLMAKTDGLYLLDLNSTNGTYLNGEMIESGQDYKLEEGDMVTFAMSEFYVARETEKN